MAESGALIAGQSALQSARSALPEAIAEVAAGIAAGWHGGAQIYVSRDHRVVANVGVGTALGPDSQSTPLGSDHILLWQSAGKPLTAIAIARLMQEGLLKLDDPVIRHIPEFAGENRADGRKETITIRNLLMHTAGIRLAGFNASEPWPRIIDQICRSRVEPRWIIGKTAGYHAFTSWYLLAEIIQRITGIAFEEWMRLNIFQPLGMIDCEYSLTPARQLELRDRLAMLSSTMESPPRAVQFERSEAAAICSPGASLRGPIHQLGRFYEALLAGGRGVIDDRTCRLFTSRQRQGEFDLSFKHIVDWGLGFIINSARYGEENVPYGFGKYASDDTFGHGGNQSCTGLCDRENRLVIAVAFTGLPGEAIHQKRIRRLLDAIYRDIGAANGPAA